MLNSARTKTWKLNLADSIGKKKILTKRKIKREKERKKEKDPNKRGSRNQRDKTDLLLTDSLGLSKNHCLEGSKIPIFLLYDDFRIIVK